MVHLLYKSSLLVAAISTLLVVPSIRAQENSTTTAPTEAAKNNSESNSAHEELRKLRDQLVKAIHDKDVDGLVNLMHEDVVLTAQDGNKLVTLRKRSGVRDYVDRMLIAPSASIKSLRIEPKVDELTILHGPSAGIAFGSSADHYELREGAEFDLNTRWSATLVKVGDQWLIANFQVSTNLFDNPVTNSIKRFSTTAAIMAAGIGLFVGFLISRLTSR